MRGIDVVEMHLARHTEKEANREQNMSEAESLSVEEMGRQQRHLGHKGSAVTVNFQ